MHPARIPGWSVCYTIILLHILLNKHLMISLTTQTGVVWDSKLITVL